MWWFWRFPSLCDDLDGSLVVVGFCCFENVELVVDGLWRICCGGLTLVG